RVNTATLGDTIKTNSFIQLRGEVQGISSSLLPDGNQVKWDAASTLIMKNTGGDYWEYQFKMYPADLLLFKLWAGHDKNTPIYRNLGWEGPVTPYDGSAQAYRLFTAGMRDTTLDIEYFNSTGDNAAQYYTPLKPKTDSTGILFRVNMLELIKNNAFDPASMYVSVRGDSASSAGILSWTSDKIKLTREEMSLGGGSFWSAPAYFPKNIVKAGAQIKFKFYVVNSKFGGWESGISDRAFSFPSADSTLIWKFFNDRKIITDVNSEKVLSPDKYELYQNYPNPFNPSTEIDYYLPSAQKVSLKVYDVLGNEAAVLVNGYMNAGHHTALFNAGHMPSGTYFYQLSASGGVMTRKMILIK
ncbi:MAG: T9SS type A sorting domain-containing protein, partial [Syntrophothermus sp.]